MSSDYCSHNRSIFTDINGIGFTGEYLSTLCIDCKKLACYHLDIIETSSRCNGTYCQCHATQQDVIQHLQLKSSDGRVDESNDKCPCGHLIKEHAYLYSQIKKRKMEPLTIISLIINGNHFINVCDFLHLKDIAVLDSAFTNHRYRPSWKFFLEKIYEFKIVFHYLYNETYIQQLLKYGIWLNLKQANVSLLELGGIDLNKTYDISEYNKVVNKSGFIDVDMTKYHKIATMWFYKYTFCRVKELRIIRKPIFYYDENEIVVWSETLNLIPDIFNNIVILELRLGNLELFNVAVTRIAKYCISLSEIYLENLDSDAVNELCKTLANSNNNSLKILSLRGMSCSTKVSSLEYIQRFDLKELCLYSYYICNKSLTSLVNNCKTLHILRLINVNFSCKLVSDFDSESLEELVLDSSYYMDETEMVADEFINVGYKFRSLVCALEYLQDTNDSTFETVTKYDDCWMGKYLWPKYKESLYCGIKFEFKNIKLSNLRILNLNDDTLITEETLINQIIRNGGKLKEVYLYNWHCTDASLDAIGDSCSNLSTIGLYVDDLRMTEAGLKRLIDKCLQLKYIVFHFDGEPNVQIPNFMLQYYPFDDICRNRNIAITFEDLQFRKRWQHYGL